MRKELIYKRIFDLGVLLLAHILLFPIWFLLWTIIPLFIWLEDRGPIFYKQKGAGRYGKEFEVYKFRTMVNDADKMGVWTDENDPRVTKVGKILRKTSMDELPSLLSILKGDMSFVGPRALTVGEQKYLEKTVPVFEKRLAVRH